MDEFKIHYQGFSPSDFARAIVRDSIAKVYDEAPSSSSVRVNIRKTRDHHFKGAVRISSGAGPFFAIASSDSLAELAHQLLERTRRQLEKWKNRRFTERRNANSSRGRGGDYESAAL